MILMAARASRTENQDAIDTAIVGMLADPKEVSGYFYDIQVRLTCSFYLLWGTETFFFSFSLIFHCVKGPSWYSRSALSAL